MVGDIDLGNGFHMRYFGWFPNRELNPQYKDTPDIERAGVTIFKDGICVAGITFDTPETEVVFKDDEHRWQVVSYDPLTVTPSIRNPNTGLHGFITNGKWIPA
jgi:hypothetical protein